jgi:hypothetical protein
MNYLKYLPIATIAALLIAIACYRRKLKKIAKNIPQSSPENRIRAALNRNERIAAIILARQEYNASLKDAVDIVNKIQKDSHV